MKRGLVALGVAGVLLVGVAPTASADPAPVDISQVAATPVEDLIFGSTGWRLLPLVRPDGYRPAGGRPRRPPGRRRGAGRVEAAVSKLHRPHRRPQLVGFRLHATAHTGCDHLVPCGQRAVLHLELSLGGVQPGRSAGEQVGGRTVGVRPVDGRASGGLEPRDALAYGRVGVRGVRLLLGDDPLDSGVHLGAVGLDDLPQRLGDGGAASGQGEERDEVLEAAPQASSARSRARNASTAVAGPAA